MHLNFIGRKSSSVFIIMMMHERIVSISVSQLAIYFYYIIMPSLDLMPGLYTSMCGLEIDML